MLYAKEPKIELVASPSVLILWGLCEVCIHTYQRKLKESLRHLINLPHAVEATSLSAFMSSSPPPRRWLQFFQVVARSAACNVRVQFPLKEPVLWKHPTGCKTAAYVSKMNRFASSVVERDNNEKRIGLNIAVWNQKPAIQVFRKFEKRMRK